MSFQQVPKGLVFPRISFCNKRYSSLKSQLAFASIAQKYMVSKKLVTDLNTDNAFSSAALDYSRLILSLDKLQITFKTAENQLNESSSDRTEMAFLKDWIKLRDQLGKRWLVTTLLNKESEDLKEQLGRLLLLQDMITDTMVYCGYNDIPCNTDFIKPFLGINHLNCYMYDATEGHALVESSAQGMENGITFVFMTGSKMIASEFGQWVIPGFRNTFDTTSGSDGVQIMIHSPDVAPMPNLDGINVSPGEDTTIGVTSTEEIRLSRPYSHCATENIEGELLMKSVEATLGYRPEKGSGMVPSVYNVGTCRGNLFPETCLGGMWMLVHI